MKFCIDINSFQHAVTSLFCTSLFWPQLCHLFWPKLISCKLDFESMDIFPGTYRVDEEVWVFHMVATPTAMWERLEADPVLYFCAKGIYAPDHHIEPILEHMRMNGVKMQKDVQRLFLERKRPWQIIVSETYRPYVMAALEKVPSKWRAVVRDKGSFMIRCHQTLPPNWRWADLYKDDLEEYR